MNFTEEELNQFLDLDEVEKEIFTEEQIKDIHQRAEQRSSRRRKMSETISLAVVEYMAKEHIGFNELTRRLQMSPSTCSKILRGDSNLTLDTLASVSEVMGKNPVISFI
jgi:hypothetical protein